jgi:hypothetical protein
MFISKLIEFIIRISFGPFSEGNKFVLEFSRTKNYRMRLGFLVGLITAGLSISTTDTAVNEALKSNAEQFKFETQVNKVMDIIIHSLYKTKGILRSYIVRYNTLIN